MFSRDGNIITTVKVSANNLNDDVNFKHIIEHALSCTLKRVDKHVSDISGLRFGTVDESYLIKTTRKEADCEWLNQALDRAVPSSTGQAVLTWSSRMSRISQ